MEETKQQAITSFESLFLSLHKHRVVLFGCDVDTDTTNLMIAELIALDKENNDPIWMLINSPGGSVPDGFALIDAIRAIKSPVNMVATGMAGSMAAFILCAGEFGRRYVMPHSTIILHQPFGRAEGQTSDVQNFAIEMERYKDLLFRLVTKATGKTKRRIQKDLDRDLLLGAQEAITYGIADEIMEKFPF